MGDLLNLRRKMQIVLQDLYSSLDPRIPIGQAIAEPLVIHKIASGSELKGRVSELRQTVGLNPGSATVIRMSSATVNVSASRWRVRWESYCLSWWRMSRFRRWISRSKVS